MSIDIRDKDNAYSLHRALKSLFIRYAMRLNAEHKWSGYVVQNRFYSSPMDEHHAWLATRFIENNPVRAGIVKNPEDYPWSSAYARYRDIQDPLISTDHAILNIADLKDELPVNFSKLHKRNLPIGSPAFIEGLEKQTGRVLHLRPIGRPRKEK